MRDFIETYVLIKRMERLWVEKCAGSGVDAATTGMLLPLLIIKKNEPVRVSDLASDLGVTQQASGKMLRALISAGLVEQIVDKYDRRAKLSALTEVGRSSLVLFENINSQ